MNREEVELDEARVRENYVRVMELLVRWRGKYDGAVEDNASAGVL